MEKYSSGVTTKDRRINVAHSETIYNKEFTTLDFAADMSEKPNRPTTLQDLNGKSPITSKEKKKLKSNTVFECRRQSLPVSTMAKLQVPNTARMINYDYNEALSCPGSPQRHYTPMTPLLTPALSLSSLVSSLDGSMENLNIQDPEDDEVEEEKNKDVEKQQIASESQITNNKLHLDFEVAHQKDIMNNRLKYFFNTLEREEYYEKHSGRDIGPINTRDFQGIRDTQLTPTSKT